MKPTAKHLGLGLLAGSMLVAGSVTVLAQNFGGNTGANRTGGTTTARTYPSRTTVGEAMITSDAQTRSIIVVADDETNEQIKRVVESLDRPKPQVLINVVFLQVAHNNDLDVGVEGSYTHTGSGGRTGTGGTDFGLAEAQALAGGGYFKIVSDDVNLLIRALAVSGKTEILSRPSILARNNQQASINIGQRIPIITGTTYGGINNTPINQYVYTDIGIILRVTPFINPDNSVEMILSPEISSLSDTKIDIGAGVEIPVIDNRSADTVVVVESGKTVVIGGLIANLKVERDTKVPVLGDIPLLGYAFKRKQKENTKTELLILMTPTVMQRPTELAQVSYKETQKLEMVGDAFEKKELNRYIERFGEAPEPDPAPESDSLKDLRQRAQEYLDQQKQAQPETEPETQP